ncbi:uncharacterized protein ARMOST_17024 [Armillaria ostoyae]|uniref:Uncharacterized protein n=1 Tax=Armillaria ostoyae TaxID=47428 RepID=A0A284RXV5_ARMOS|nr:uncharacterized protein ARMOST_17024 [Armillaria ostoyae]
MSNEKPSKRSTRNGASAIPPHNVTGGQSHQAESAMDTPGKRGEEPAVKTAAPPPPGGREVSVDTPPPNELMCFQLSQSPPSHPIPCNDAHTSSQSHQNNEPLPLNVARAPERNLCASGMRGGGECVLNGPPLPLSKERGSHTVHDPSQTTTNPTVSAPAGDTELTPAEIASDIHVQELGRSTIDTITTIRNLLLASTRAKGTKYRLGAVATEKAIDLCEMQLATLSMRPMDGARPTERTRVQRPAETVVERLEVMEKRILQAIESSKVSLEPTGARPPAIPPLTRTPTKSPTKPPPQPYAPPPPPPVSKPKHHHVVVSLSGMKDTSHLRDITPRQMSARVQEAIRGCGVPSLENLDVIGTQFTGKTRMKVYVRTDQDAQALLEAAEAWTPKLGPGAALVVRTWSVVVDSVPTTFRPTNKDDLAYLFQRNPEVTPTNLRQIRWLKESSAKDPAKRDSSIVLAISDYDVASEVAE